LYPHFFDIDDHAKWNSFNQIVISQLYELHSLLQLGEQLEDLPTQYLFIFGKQKVRNYKIAADKFITCQIMASVLKVNWHSHDGIHIFPLKLLNIR
jgi:hypothetical protein